MLARFSVKNFRNFSDTFTFNFRSEKNYEFNSENIDNKIIKHSVIYGHNGSGKSNLGLAMLDIAYNINDIDVTQIGLRKNYINGNSESSSSVAEFEYEFDFDGDIVIYRYSKKDIKTTVREELIINNQTVVFMEKDSFTFEVNLSGAENLITDTEQLKISAIKYIKSNTVLAKNSITNDLFGKFVEFVNKMLFFRTLTPYADYYGQIIDTTSLSKEIIDNDKVQDFEDFLKASGVDCNLTVIGEGEAKKIAFKYEKENIEFNLAASTGTMSLGIFYYWWMKIENGEYSFVYLDEFDAYYHYLLSQLIVEKMVKCVGQTVLTTHNSALLSNDFLRPDCYFVISGNKPYPFYTLVDKDLRKAHNLEKIFRGIENARGLNDEGEN